MEARQGLQETLPGKPAQAYRLMTIASNHTLCSPTGPPQNASDAFGVGWLVS